MGRARKGLAPFKFYWNQSDATATNVFLLLVPKGPLASRLRDAPALAGALRDVLAAVDLAELIGHGRVYGGGLHKLEPRELGRLDVSSLASRLGLVPTGQFTLAVGSARPTAMQATTR